MASIIYSGQSEVKVDAKCRIAIPAKDRENLGETFHILLALDHCLNIIDNKGFETVSRNISKMSFETSAKMARRWNAFSFEVKADKQGRIVIPPQLRNRLSIEPGDELVVAGAGPRIEVWHKSEWDSAFELTEEEYPKCARAFSFSGSDDENE